MDERLQRNATQFVKFCVVGGSGVVDNLAVLNLPLLIWKHTAGGEPLAAKYLANGLAFVVSVLTNYYLNRRWTFQSQAAIKAEVAKFYVVSAIAYVINLGVFTLCITRFHLETNIGQLIAIACVLPINFVLNKLWSFRGS
jgi:putative flippase GtrA